MADRRSVLAQGSARVCRPAACGRGSERRRRGRWTRYKEPAPADIASPHIPISCRRRIRLRTPAGNEDRGRRLGRVTAKLLHRADHVLPVPTSVVSSTVKWSRASMPAAIAPPAITNIATSSTTKLREGGQGRMTRLFGGETRAPQADIDGRTPLHRSWSNPR